MDYKEIAHYIIKNGLHAGIRGLKEDEDYQVGDYTRESYDHNFEHDASEYDVNGEEGRTLGGTCATEILRGEDNDGITWEYKDDAENENYVNHIINNIKQAIEVNNGYAEGKTVIIAGDYNNTDVVSDDQEIVIVDAKVIAILN